MATWQYRVWMVPIDAVGDDPVSCAAAIHDGATAFWPRHSLAQVTAAFDGLGVSRTRSWQRDAVQWGELDSNYVTVGVSKGQVQEIAVGFDARTTDNSFAMGVSRCMRSLGVVLIDHQGHVTSHDLADIEGRISESAAGRFVRNPRKHLDDVARANEKPKR